MSAQWKLILERKYVAVLSWMTRLLSFLPLYRIALGLYPLESQVFRGFFTEIPYLRSGYLLRIKLWSKSLIDHKVLFTGVYEASTNKVLERYVHAGNTVIEAGANMGTETLLLSRLAGPNGAVYAFEPVPALIDRLEENCRLNALANVVEEKLALGEVNKTIAFYIADEQFTNQGMGSKQAVNPHLKHEILVQQITLDAYCQRTGIEQVDFIKMDIQGAELDLLKGGEEIIGRCKPTIFLEAGEGWSSLDALYDWLCRRGYVIYFVADDGILEGPMLADMIRPGNWMAIFEKKLS